MRLPCVNGTSLLGFAHPNTAHFNNLRHGKLFAEHGLQQGVAWWQFDNTGKVLRGCYAGEDDVVHLVQRHAFGAVPLRLIGGPIAQVDSVVLFFCTQVYHEVPALFGAYIRAPEYLKKVPGARERNICKVDSGTYICHQFGQAGAVSIGSPPHAVAIRLVLRYIEGLPSGGGQFGAAVLLPLLQGLQKHQVARRRAEGRAGVERVDGELLGAWLPTDNIACQVINCLRGGGVAAACWHFVLNGPQHILPERHLLSLSCSGGFFQFGRGGKIPLFELGAIPSFTRSIRGV